MSDNTCSTCEHWKNKQRLLNFSRFTGFCVNPKFRFNTTDGRLVGVIDTSNLKDRSKITGNPSHDIETFSVTEPLRESRYLLQTEEKFGCIFHQK